MSMPNAPSSGAAPAALPSSLRLWLVPVVRVHAPVLTALLVFIALAIPSPTERKDLGIVAMFLVITFCALIPAHYALFHIVAAPYRRVSRALASGVAPTSLDPRDVVKVLRLPFFALFVAITAWGLGGSLLFIVDDVGSEALQWRTPLLVGVAWTLGFITAPLSFYACQRYLALHFIPRALPDNDVDRLGPFRPIRVFDQIAVLVILLAVVEPISISLLRDIGLDAPAIVPFIYAMFAVSALALGVGISIAVTFPLGALVDLVRAVRAGDLSVRARVTGLDTLSVLGTSFNQMIDGLKQRDFIKETFGRYVARDVVDVILSGRVELGGERRVATVLFSDIRGFTRLSENMAPEEVVEFLNEYLDAMVDCVIAERGMLDKFIGDAVMAVFGVPVSDGVEADAARAARAAIAMSARLDEMNARRVARGQQAIEIGIGIHTGELVAGNIGSKKRMEYTVIGDSVNLASRLESMTKELHERVVVSEVTAAHLQRDASFAASLVDVGRLAVRGRERDIGVYAVRAPSSSGSSVVEK